MHCYVSLILVTSLCSCNAIVFIKVYSSLTMYAWFYVGDKPSTCLNLNKWYLCTYVSIVSPTIPCIGVGGDSRGFEFVLQ